MQLCVGGNCQQTFENVSRNGGCADELNSRCMQCTELLLAGNTAYHTQRAKVARMVSMSVNIDSIVELAAPEESNESPDLFAAQPMYLTSQ